MQLDKPWVDTSTQGYAVPNIITTSYFVCEGAMSFAEDEANPL